VHESLEFRHMLLSDRTTDVDVEIQKRESVSTSVAEAKRVFQKLHSVEAAKVTRPDRRRAAKRPHQASPRVPRWLAARKFVLEAARLFGSAIGLSELGFNGPQEPIFQEEAEVKVRRRAAEAGWKLRLEPEPLNRSWKVERFAKKSYPVAAPIVKDVAG
jgi:anti-sigma factor RsiW